MLKNTLLIALVIAIIYLYYQNKKASSDNSAPTEELIATRDAALRSKNEAEEKLTNCREKYSQQSRLLDEEQLENNKLVEKVAELEAELEQLKKDQEWPPLNNSPKTKK